MDIWTGVVGSKELLSALIGALIGGLFTMWATHRTQKGESDRATQEWRHNRAQVEDERQQTLANTAQLILVEVTTAWNVYRAEYAAELMQIPDGAPYLCVFPIGDKSFPIFDSAPASLAQLPPATSQQIVRFYMRAKGMISMINMNNIDTERAREFANVELQKRSSQTESIAGFETDPAEISARYDQDAKRMASLLGMGSTADGLKGLTNEIEGLVLDIQARLTQ
ncbi:hypothetical protein ALQ32_200206 [Pseudomonas syringae pv. tagetis]|uniref:Uncharacterized protein n=1 Tax=Pseudomonas syringae pv. tagetis TaxID=129140 RepID=A0A3M3ZGB4_9PSED|nr:hypothetical protein [Pseudomonas syringae group genomosp. 7]RMO93701.1 hypothetical protein ALQ32_200206 [Pseudomonas syringae pv. tagetis]